MFARVKKGTALVPVFMALILVLTACGGGAKPEGPKSEINAEGAYDPPIDLVSVKSVDATVKFLGDDDIYDNVWTRSYRDKLGINLKYDWVVDASQYAEKLSLSVMSNDVPDVFVCGPLLFKMLEESDLLADLTDVYQEHASENTKYVLEQDPLAMLNATLSGRIKAIPLTSSSIAGSHMLWIRLDWMQKLKLDPPESIQDVIEIARKFKEMDPDGNGKDDTYGLALSKELWAGFGGLQGFFNGFHAYPRMWIEKNGAIEYGSIQAEMKQALAELQKLYKEGILDQEFGAKDSNKIREDIANSKIGMEYGLWWNPYEPLHLSQANVPDAYWQAYHIPSADDKDAKSQYSATVGAVIVVRKDYAYPEAAYKLLNFWCDNFLDSDDQDIRDEYLGSLDNPDVVKYKYTDFHIWEPNATFKVYDNVIAALRKGSMDGLNQDELMRYQVISAYFDQGIKEAWSEVATHGEQGAIKVLKGISEGKGMLNEFYGAPTDIMADRIGALHSLEDEVFTKIIMGESIDRFDEFVKEWKQMGGDEVIAEVNEWWTK